MGEDTYAVMRTRKRLQELWDVYGMATAGASAAASPIVASTLFASTAGPLAFLGIGAAATPIGWVLASGVAAGGLYFGLTRWVSFASPVDVIPRAVNTPLDVLAMSLFDLIGSLAVRVAAIDGEVSEPERKSILDHFVEDWGYDEAYAKAALDALDGAASEGTVKAFAESLARFQVTNPDCRADQMQAELMDFLQDLVRADGKVDEREELALDAISATFKAQRKLTLARVRDAGSVLAKDATSAIQGSAAQLVRFGAKLKTPRSSES